MPLLEGLKASAFRDFAIACDKYNCHEAVQFVTREWLRNLGPTVEGDELWILLGAVAFLGEYGLFRKLTSQLIMSDAKPFLSRPVNDTMYPFPALELYGTATTDPNTQEQIPLADV